MTEYRYNSYGERTASIQYAGSAYDLTALAVTDVPTESTMTTWVGSQNKVLTQRSDMAYDARGQLQSVTAYAKADSSGNGVSDGSQSVTQYTYSQAGELLQTISATTGTTTFTYDGLGRVLSTQNALSQSTLNSYDDANRKTSTTLASGLITTRTFDASGRLVSVLQTNSAAANLGTTQYFYDADGRLLMTQDATGARTWSLYDDAGRKIADIDGKGGLTEYIYNKDNQVTLTITYATAVNTATLVNGSNLPSNPTLASIRPTSSALDRKSWSAYDTANRLAKSVDAQGAVTEYAYDGTSRQVAVTRYANLVSTSGLGNAPTASSIAPTMNAADRVVRSFYDDQGLLRGTLDAEGFLTEIRYDAAGRLTSRLAYATATTPSLRASGTLAQLLPTASAADQTTLLIYNGKGQVAGQIDSEGYLTEFVYDANGNTTQSVRYATVVAPVALAAVGVATVVSDVRPTTAGEDQSTTRVYDLLNRITQETNAEGTLTQYTYDNVGQLVSTARAVSTAEVRTLNARYDLQGRLTGELTGEGSALLTGGLTQAQIDAVWAQYGLTHAYDAAGRRTSTTDAYGNKTLFFYDATNRLTHSVNALGEVSESKYDAMGRLAQTIRYGTRISLAGLGGTNAGGLVNSALTAAIDAVKSATLDSTVTYTYNATGTVATVTDALGFGTAYSYDAFGQATGSTQAIGGGRTRVQSASFDRRGLQTGTADDTASINAITSAIYDAFGRVTSSTDANGNVRSQTYDRLGRVITTTDPLSAVRSTSYDAFSRVLSQTNALGKTTSYAYSKTARSVAVTTPEGITVTTTRTRLGQLLSVTDGKGNVTTYTYDKNGNRLSTTTALTTQATTYDRADRVAQTTDANGNVVVYTYDAASRVLTRAVDPTGLNLVTTYQYDAKGQQVGVTDANSVLTQLFYDLKGELVKQVVDPTGLNLITQYTYDGRGKTLIITSPLGTQVQYTYDNLGRRTLEQTDPAGLNISRSYAYDKRGNVTGATDALGALTRYAYDASDQLVYTVDPLGRVTQNVYDAAGRITKTVSYLTPISTAGLATAPTPAQIVALVTTNAQDAVNHSVYDNDGRLNATVNALGEVVKFTYDANGNVVDRVAYANRIAMGTWTPGTLPAPTADSTHDQRVRTVYDALNRATYTINGVGAVVYQSYDGNGNVVDRIGYAALVPVATAATASALAAAAALVANTSRDSRTRMAYDKANRLTYSANGLGAVTQRLYDANGNATKTIQYATAIGAGAALNTVAAAGADRISVATYDAANRQVYSVNALGAVSQLLYDANGNVVQRIAYATAVAAPTVGSTTTTAYYQGLVSTSVTGDRIERFAYDAAGRQVFNVNGLGATTESSFDAAGHVIQTRQYATLISTTGLSAGASESTVRARVTADAANDRITRSTFDAAGQRIYQVDAAGYVKLSAYNGLGQVTSTTEYSLAIPAATANTTLAVAAAIVTSAANDRTNTFAFDAAGRLTGTTDALGFTESYTYDGLGNKLSLTNKKAAVWTYDYDATGRLVTETSPLVGLYAVTTDASFNLVLDSPNIGNFNIVTRLAYDALGNLTSRTEAQGRPEQRITQYEYDALGRQIKTIFPPVYVYNAAVDNLTTNGASSLATRTELLQTLYTRVTYDTLGNAVANRDMAGSMSYKTYDVLGQVTFDVDVIGYVTGYTRDVFGSVTELKRYGAVTTLTSGNPASLTTAGVTTALNLAGVDHSEDRLLLNEYDLAGRVSKVTEPLVYAYDSSAAVGQRYFTAGKITQNTYDAFGGLKRAAVLANSVTNSWVYTNHYFDQRGSEIATVDALGFLTTQAFDAAGNRVARTEYATAVTSWNGAAAPASAPTVTSSQDDRTLLSTYDRGNRKSADTRVNVEYSDPTSVSSSTVRVRGNLSTTYGYDAVGNLVRTTDANGAVTYSYYNALGHVSAVVAPTRNSTVAGTSLTPLTSFFRDAYGNVLMKVDFANGVSAANETSYTPATGSAVDNRTEYARYDLMGHVMHLMDAGGINHYRSYNALGLVAKDWQAVTGNDGIVKTQFKAYQYDKLGRQTHVLDPASTTVIQGGMSSLTFSSATRYFNNPWSYQYGYAVSGSNSATLSWATLTDPSGGMVKIQVDYYTLSTQYVVDDGESSYYVGYASHAATQTRDLTAAAAANGATITWANASNWEGGIDSLSYVRVWQQDAQGYWIVKWAGSPAQATGSGVNNVTQAAAGINDAGTEYNAFGEVSRKGINGGWQEYFKYDNAGHLWQTNAGDGIDKALLYDLLGRQTAQISSAGNGHTVITPAAFTSASTIAGLTDVRRTDMVYDALGRVVSQLNPERVDVQGPAAARRSLAQATVNSSAVYSPPVYNESGGLESAGYWASSNSVTLAWQSMAGLGSGDMKVTIDYVGRGAMTHYGGTITGYDEDGSPIYSGGYWAYADGAAASRTQTLTAEQGVAGMTMTWVNPVPANEIGINRVTRLQVWKKSVTGTWQAVVDKSTFGNLGNTIEVVAPANPDTVVELQTRVGTGTWTTRTLTKFDDAYRFDASALGSGTWEYRVNTTAPGEATRVTSTGTMTIASDVLTLTGAGNGDTRLVRPVVNQKFDRWGNVTEMSDVRNAAWKTTYSYNANNQVVQQTQPDATGAASANSPVTQLYYDKMGRQIAIKDANSKVNGQVFDDAGQLVTERQADGGVVTYAYNSFDKVKKTDGRGIATTFSYDKLSRLLTTTYGTQTVYTVNASNALTVVNTRNITETNTWDQAGRKLTQTNGNGEILKYTYDLVGNVLQTVLPLTQSAKGVFDYKGRKVAEVDANGNSNTWTYNYFKMTAHTDLANNRTVYTYDAAQQLITQISTLGQNLAYQYDAAGQLTRITDSALNKVTAYAYDLAGNHIQETTTQAGVVYQDNHMAYDALSRMRWVGDSRAYVNMEYDKVGNRTRIQTHVIYGDNAPPDEDRYFQYDAMNRQTKVDAADAAGTLGAKGHTITYDYNGNRLTDTYVGTKVTGTTSFTTTQATVVDTYTYDNLNHLSTSKHDTVVIDQRFYDGAGRVLQTGAGTTIATAYQPAYFTALYGSATASGTGTEQRTNRYDANGRLVFVKALKSSLSAKYNLNYSSYDAAGNLATYSLVNYDGTSYTNTYNYTQLKRDAYKEQVISATSTYFSPGSTTNTYDVNSNLVAVTDSTAPANNRTFINDAAGRILFKTQNGNVDRQLIVNGEVLGRYGTNGSGTASSSFNFGYAPISGSFPAATPGTWAITASDTLQSIAKSAYGDSSLWYLIADANGLSSDRDLRVGQTLTVPNRVTGAKNNSKTFKPYDPSAVVGDTMPNLPNPPPPPAQSKGGGCGFFGQIITVVIAVVVAFVAPQFLPTFITQAGPVVTAMATAAVVSTATQVAAVALGIQDKFSWKSVALSAISGGITQGLGGIDFTGAGTTEAGLKSLGNVIVRSAVANALTQGIGVVTGLQSKFDWRGVAASAVGAGVGKVIGDALNDNVIGVKGVGRDDMGNKMPGYSDSTKTYYPSEFAAASPGLAQYSVAGLTSFVAGAAVAATRGGRVALQQVALDAFGNTLGASLAQKLVALPTTSPSDNSNNSRNRAFESMPGVSDSRPPNSEAAPLGAGVALNAEPEPYTEIAATQGASQESPLSAGSASEPLPKAARNGDPNNIIDAKQPGLYAMEKIGDQWVAVQRVDAVATEKAAINGMLNSPGYAAWLMGSHVEQEFQGTSKFTLFYNPTEGVLADAWESLRDKLGFTTDISKQFANVLSNVQSSGQKVDWVAHSQAGIIFAESVRTLGSDLSSNSVVFHSGGNNEMVTNSILENSHVRVLGYRDNPFDPIPTIAGINTLNPIRILGSLLSLPLVFWGGPEHSPHTMPHIESQK